MNKIFKNNIVSVVIPVYNAEKYLRETVMSALNQTYTNVEIILIDDNSTDKSSKIIKELQQHFSNIIYYRQPQNRGAGVARNMGLSLARGRFIAFLDADDVWKEDKLAMQIQCMNRTKSPFIYTAIEMINELGEVIKSQRVISEKVNYHFLLRNTVIATSSVLIDRNFFGDFRMSDRRGGQDYATWLKLLRDGCEAIGLKAPLVQYRRVANSLSSNKFKSIHQVWEIQTQDEHLPKMLALLNVGYFIVNALKKYYF